MRRKGQREDFYPRGGLETYAAVLPGIAASKRLV